MTDRAIPLVLNNYILGDGERAFLLAMCQGGPGFPPIELYAPPAINRPSRMKMALIVQLEIPKFGLNFTVRAPSGLGGTPMDAPVITATGLGASSFFPLAAIPLVGGINGILTDWPNTGDIGLTAPGYAPTFNGKDIPNWSFGIYMNNSDAPGQFFVTVDFSHSIV
jgi:hypothetical protein